MKGLRTGGVVLLLVSAGLGLIVLLVLQANGEPTYSRRALRAWVREYSSPNSTAGWTSYSRSVSYPAPNYEAEQAIRHIGSQAVPWLLKWLRYQTPGYKLKLYRAIDALPRGKFRDRIQNWLPPDRYLDWRQASVRAFWALGPEAKSAVPELCRMMNDRASGQILQHAATSSLLHIGPDALLCLLNSLTNRACLWRYDIVQGVGEMNLGTNGSIAVEALVRCLEDRDDLAVAEAAARLLGKLRLSPEMVVPALIVSLQATNSGVRLYAAYSLASFGSAASPAIPLLTANLTNENALVRMTATNCLQKLAPHAVERP